MEGSGRSDAGARVRVRPGARQRPPRDPRPWRRARVGANVTAATRADVAEVEMPHYVAAALDPREGRSFLEEFPDGPYGMAEDAPPHGRAMKPGQRAIGREADPLRFTPYPYDRDYGPLTGAVAAEPPTAGAADPPSVVPPASGDEPSD